MAGWRNHNRSRTSFKLTIDGRRCRRRAHTVMVANLGRITGGVELIEGAAPEGGTLQVAVLGARGVWNLARVAMAAIVGDAQRRALLDVRRARRIRIQAAQPQPVQLDGNDAGRERVLEITIEPGALQLVRPALPKGETAPAPAFPRTVAAARRWGPLAAVAAALVAAAYLIGRKRSGG